MFKNIIFLIATAVSLDSAFAAFDDSTSCTFFRPGVPGCSDVVSSDVADLIGGFLNGRENYAIIKHPFDIYIVVDVDWVYSWKSISSNLFINGVFLYVVVVNGNYFVKPTVGCYKPYILRRTSDNVVGLNNVKNCELFDAMEYASKLDQYNTSCNALQARRLIGPYPAAQSFVSGGNVLIQTTSLTSAVFVTVKEKIAHQLEAEARRNELNVNIKIDGRNVIVTQNRNPAPPPCVRSSNNIFQQIPQGINPDFCYLSLLTAQEFTYPTSYEFGSLVYIKMVILQHPQRAYVYIEGYLTKTLFDDVLLDNFLASC